MPFAQFIGLAALCGKLGLDGGDPLKIRVFGFAFQAPQARYLGGQLLIYGIKSVGRLISQRGAGAGLVKKVDGLIGQKPVVYISFGKRHGLTDDTVGKGHP